MANEAQNEAEVINAIYENCMVQHTNALFDINIPDSDCSLRLSFPRQYPEQRPEVISASSHIPLNILKDILQAIFIPDQIVVFDLIEAVRPLLPEQGQQEQEQQQQVQEKTDTNKELQQWIETEWDASDMLVDRKSQFLARACKLDPAQGAQQALDKITHLKQDKRVARATHNISAYRIVRPDGVLIQDCDDDGETAAGGRLLHLLQLTNAQNVLVVVSRWYGGIQLGPDRFKHINSCARQALVNGGFV